MKKNLIYKVSVIYLDLYSVNDIDVQVYVYDTYEQARERLEKAKERELQALDERDTSYEIVFDDEDRFFMNTAEDTVMDVQITCQEINLHPYEKFEKGLY